MKKFLKENIDPDLKVGDLVMVNGVFEDKVTLKSKDDIKVFENVLGVIIDQKDSETFYLIKFFDWNKGHNAWNNSKCGMRDCFYLPREKNKIFKGSIKLVNRSFTVDDVSDIFSSLNENQEEDWWEHLMKDPNQKARLDYYEDLRDKNRALEPGDNIEIMINQDGLDIDGDVMIVGSNPNNDDQYLVKLPKVVWSDEGDPTHCGNKPQHHKMCECEEDYEGSRIGKCWFVNLSDADRLYLYPNRKGDKFLKIK